MTVRNPPERPVFRYNAGPVAPPPRRNGPNAESAIAYIHPAFSPGGALVTGDFSRSTRTTGGSSWPTSTPEWGDLPSPTSGTSRTGSGRIVADGFDPPRADRSRAGSRPATAGRRRGRAAGDPRPRSPSANDGRIELYDVPGSPYWLFDLTSTQQAEGHPLEVLPHRYGGMAYRSAEPSVVGPLDVLTAEGRHRFDGDQKPTRWVDLTGPVADGSPNYAGR